MKTTKILSMAALVLMGTIFTGCSNKNNEEPEQSKQDYKVTLTTTVSFASDDEVSSPARDLGEGVEPIVRALGADGVKTFAAGDKLAVIYMNYGGTMTKVETEELEAGDITNSGKTATFTVTLTEEPLAGKIPLTYIYPASIATSDGYVDNSQLNSQDGTLATLASNLDACRGYDPAWSSSGDLPALTLHNAFAIGKFTIKNPSGTAINNDLTGMTITDGTNTYTITPSASTASDPIWVAMLPVWEGSTVNITATDGTNYYAKSVTIASGKDLLAGNIYPINVTMRNMVIDLSALEDDYEAQDGEILTGESSGVYKITIAAGATITLREAMIVGAENYAGIECPGDATIVLSGANMVIANGASNEKAGIYIADGYTLTINGSGSLDVSGGADGGAGIGGNYAEDCGNITIESGTITATGYLAAGIGSALDASCGDITLSGGTITAESDDVCIGGDEDYSSCSNITINGSANLTLKYSEAAEDLLMFLGATEVILGETDITDHISGTVNDFLLYMKSTSIGFAAEISLDKKTLSIY